MKQNLLDSFKDTKILTLGEIIRYNDRPKIKNETVAAHSFYVAANVIKICKLFNVENSIKYDALEMAVVHDMAEIFTGDIGYITKRDNPELAKALEVTELKQLEEHMPEYYVAFRHYVEGLKDNDVAAIIVKLADVISVLQYSCSEIELGNKSLQMADINADAIDRVQIYIQKLKRALEK